MPARPIASATVSFGLVSVPVQLFSAAETQSAISFNLLHKKEGCGSRLKQQYFCLQEGVKVERDEMIKGYEFAKGQYVQFTTEEIKALEEKRTGTIEVGEFVPLARVDRVFVDKVYYLGPDKGGERAYRLLAEALRETGRAALGQYAARGKQYLILIRPQDGGLVMEQLHYADEVRSMKDVPLEPGEVKPQELKLAVQLIEQAATDEFNPAAYKDNVRERIKHEIDQKVEGKQITTEPEEAPQTQIIDLMEALKASVARGKVRAEPPEASPQSEEAEEPRAAPRRRKAGGSRR